VIQFWRRNKLPGIGRPHQRRWPQRRPGSRRRKKKKLWEAGAAGESGFETIGPENHGKVCTLPAGKSRLAKILKKNVGKGVAWCFSNRDSRPQMAGTGFPAGCWAKEDLNLLFSDEAWKCSRPVDYLMEAGRGLCRRGRRSKVFQAQAKGC